MVGLVESEERRFPNPIADATIEQSRPQRLACRHVLAAKCDALQSNDSGIARGEMAPPRMERPQNEFDHIAVGIAKTRQGAHFPRCARLLGANGSFDAVLRELRDGSLELRPSVYLEADGTFRRFTEKEDQRVIAHVGAKVSDGFAPG